MKSLNTKLVLILFSLILFGCGNPTDNNIASGDNTSIEQMLTDPAASDPASSDPVLSDPLPPQDNSTAIKSPSDPSSSTGGTSTGTIATPNIPPVALNDEGITQEDSPLILDTILSNDSDVDMDALSISAVDTSTLNGATIKILTPTSILYTPKENYYGTDEFQYTIADGKGGSASAIVSILVKPVNDTPIANDDSVSGKEDNAIDLLGLLSNDIDVDKDTLSIKSFSPTSSNKGTISRIDATSLRYIPPANFSGNDSFSYTASDNAGGEAVAVVSISISPVNDAPLANDDAFVTQEDVYLDVNNLLANDTDVDGDTLSIQSFNIASTQGGTIEKLAGNILRYTPALNFHGTDEFSYIASDGKGGTSTARVIINVTSVNDLPVAQNDNVDTQEDTAIDILTALSNDSDIDGGVLKILAADLTTLAGGKVLLQGGTVLHYTPPANFHGMDQFNYTIADDVGAQASATIFITVSSVNDKPVANNDSAVTQEDTPLLLSGLLANDSDVDGDTLSISNFSAQTLAGGTLIQVDNTTLRYTPPANFFGKDSFIYTVSDPLGGTAQAQVSLVVNSVNDLPVAIDDSAMTQEDSPLLLSALLANDSDVDGDTLSITSFSAQTLAGGTVTRIDSKTLRYTPLANYFGKDSFTYTVSDPQGGTAQAQVNLTVNSVNDIPVAKSDSASLLQGQTANINVLTNDSGLGDGITLTIDTMPLNGLASIDNSGLLSYQPNASFFGSDSLTYKIVDSNGDISIANVSFDVTCVSNCNHTFQLSWNASVSTNVVGYKVYVGTSASNLSEVIQVGNVLAYQYQVTAQGTYYFAVAAVNDMGVESSLSTIESAMF